MLHYEHMEKNNKHLIIAGAAIIIVVALAIGLSHMKKNSSNDVTDTPSIVVPDITTTSSSTTSGQVAWDATLKKYENSDVTFAADCTASPVTQALKKGTTVLLVNDSDVAHNITIGAQSYSIGARHYKTMVLSGAGTTVINCDSHPNVANIGVE